MLSNVLANNASESGVASGYNIKNQKANGNLIDVRTSFHHSTQRIVAGGPKNGNTGRKTNQTALKQRIAGESPSSLA